MTKAICIEDLRRIQNNEGLWNFLDKNNRLVLDKWYLQLGVVIDGFACVQREDTYWNYVDANGKILSPRR